MLDIGFPELMLVAVVGLLVIGPERLPAALRTLGLWIGRLSRSFSSVKAEIEKEIGMDEVKRQLHNESIMAEMKRIEREVQTTVDEAGNQVKASAEAVESPAETNAAQADPEPTDDQPTTADTQTPVAAETPPLPPTDADLEAAYQRKTEQR